VEVVEYPYIYKLEKKKRLVWPLVERLSNLLDEGSHKSLLSKGVLSPPHCEYQRSRISPPGREVLLNKGDAAIARYCDTWFFACI
jgi:hypothetical protein